MSTDQSQKPTFIYTDRQGFDPEKVQYWANQMALFNYHPPDGNDGREWGIPSHLKTPADCIDYVVGVFKREMGGVTVSRLAVRDPADEPKIIPNARFQLIMTCHAHFLWFRTKEGARYIMSLQGVEEVAPFSEGYVYYYVDPSGKRFEVSERTGMKLRVFQPRQRNYEPPIVSGNLGDTTIQQMKVILERCRSPLASTDRSWQAEPGLYRWVSSKIHDWLSEPKVDYDFPFEKRDRISGPQWIKSAVRSDGQPLFNAIGKVEAFKDRAYRIEDSTGGTFWCTPRQIDHFGKVEVARNEGMPDDQVGGFWRCDSCGQIRTCTTPTTSNGQPAKYCKHCIGHFVEKDLRPSLEWCTYRECKGCPDYIRSQDELVQIRTRLNQGARFPVQRG